MPVTKATNADIAQLSFLVNSAYRGETSKKGWTTESHLLDGNRIDEVTLAGYLCAPEITILKYSDDDKQIKACAYLEEKGTELYLGMLSVFPELQASGLGGLMLQEAEAFASKKGIGVITISVISSRTELTAWYKRRGYNATGEVLPFHVDEKFGIPKEKIELITMKKHLTTLL